MDFFSDIVDSICDLFEDNNSSSKDDDNELLEYYFESVPIMGGTEGVESMYGAGDSNDNSSDDPEPETNV